MRNYKWYSKSCRVLQDHYDDERDKTVFHNTTLDLQDQDQHHSVQDQDLDYFGLRPGLVLKPTVSDNVTDWTEHIPR